MDPEGYVEVQAALSYELKETFQLKDVGLSAYSASLRMGLFFLFREKTMT